MCDSIVSLYDRTRDGYTIFGKSSDRSANEPQYFVFCPAKDHARGATVRCTYVDVEQAEHTNAVILSKPSWIWGGEIGVNEHGVAIGNESVFSKELDTRFVGLLGMDIVRLALERSTTARQAVDVIAAMMEQYGQGGNASFDGTFYYDNAYLVTDGKEAWHVETAGRHYWAAKQVKGSYSISNYLSINYPDILHRELVSHAVKSGYPVDEPFDFAKAYVDWDSPVNHSGMLRRACSYQLVNKPGDQLGLRDMMNVLRSHTVTDPWRKGDACVCMHATGGDLACETTNSMIAVCVPGDTLLWGPGMGVTCVAPFQPFWFDAYSQKLVFAYDRQEEAMDSWLKRERISRAVLDGRICEADYKAEMAALEMRWMAEVAAVARGDRQALCDRIAGEEEIFIEKWLRIASDKPSRPSGDEAFQAFWREKNAALGKNRTIAY